MKTIYKYTFLLGLMLFFFGCQEEDILDKSPLTEISETDVWSDPGLVEAFVNARYNQVGHGWTESWQSSVVDETYLTWSRGCEPYTQGYVNPSDLGRMNGGWWGWDNRSWATVWGNIANCNLFFERIDEVEFADETYKDRLVGEVTFIRALMYFDLVARWGGMPLITKSYTLNDREEYLSVARDSYKDNVDFIVSECDKAADLLPASYDGSDKGRATSVAALALKSRMLLYAASPLMNKSGVNPLVGYSAPDADRWKNAADAAKACIDAALDNGYALYQKYDDVKENYTQLFLDGGNSEVLFDREGGLSADGDNLTGLDQTNGPNGYGLWGGNTPISEFVDDFEMADGTKFDWDNPVHKANPYANRDARLYATVLADGDPWRERNVQTYLIANAAGDITGGGKDTKYGQDSWNTSKSSYNVRKYMDETYVPNSWNFTNPKNWIWFRLGEQYLNYAEALYNQGLEDEARTALNVIRARAKMPDVTATGDDLWDAIVNERRVELCFEEHRYYDVRRWLIAEDVLNRNATGVEIVLHPNGTKTYEPGVLVEQRLFNAPAMYWMPIPKWEIDKNANLEQNPGY
ncbi:RagB/SusD family nutrient uptake outer membrane protein [Mangrovibacterium diazotrophicum]|uniref:Putative outer membrane starch-binding protein n=1 Tax=Mangrovibacterium diazotrophicum TaxID=1261403 RepID=A0A419W8M3_9BACT|nr:RagB/SusD family nutrient uptake outer membrane protein [Mangrovibacterium diazotrophicum]RKD91821.1 putative outer membrane starch-binding protein [Mangrovibacterium diazotrophicum]